MTAKPAEFYALYWQHFKHSVWVKQGRSSLGLCVGGAFKTWINTRTIYRFIKSTEFAFIKKNFKVFCKLFLSICHREASNEKKKLWKQPPLDNNAATHSQQSRRIGDYDILYWSLLPVYIIPAVSHQAAQMKSFHQLSVENLFSSLKLNPAAWRAHRCSTFTEHTWQWSQTVPRRQNSTFMPSIINHYRGNQGQYDLWLPQTITFNSPALSQLQRKYEKLASFTSSFHTVNSGGHEACNPPVGVMKLDMWSLKAAAAELKAQLCT